MGIPSYFRKLSTTIPNLISRNRPVNSKLYFDFNCLIYHVLRRPDRDAYDSNNVNEWEQKFLNDIAKYTLKVIQKVEPSEEVHIHLDGVVPMAKIKQQRMRRFRSAAAAAKSQSESDSAVKSFNTNALTPGTEFMKKLSTRLSKFIKDNKPSKQKWSLSDTLEYGEGEHKIMFDMRKSSKNKDPYVIYGLDADLIVLALWHYAKTGQDIYLFREDIEGGEIQRNSLGEEEFIWFSVTALAEYLKTQFAAGSEQSKLEDYCASMMILGNDFIPTSMTFRIKDGGHDDLLEFIKSADWLYKDGVLNTEEFNKLFTYLAANEEKQLCYVIRKKLQAVGDWEQDQENLPLKWRAEECLVDISTSNYYSLKPDWKQIYTSKIFASYEKEKEAVKEYLKGMLWILKYYMGENVDYTWFYPWSYPPLWSTIIRENRWQEAIKDIEEMKENKLNVDQQLALVLPLESWGLINNTSKYYDLPLKAPEWFPAKFHTNSLGKRWLWECEPEIPIPSVVQLNYLYNDAL